MNQVARIALAAMIVPSLASAGGPIQDDPALKNLDWLAICPVAWRPQVDGYLRAHRSYQGYHAGIWTLEEVDATYGGHTPTHLREALLEAYTTWTTHPLRWVFLVGDHERDNGVNDFIGDWRQYNPELGFPGEDDNLVGLLPYMDLNDDNIPDIFVGRLPASSPTDVTNYAMKVLYHDAATDPTYGRSLMLVGDEDYAGNTGAWARTVAVDLYDNWVNWGTKQTVLVSQVVGGSIEREAAAITPWDLGPGLVVTLGTKSGWWLFTSFWDLCSPSPWSINKLAATTKFPVVLALSCGSTGTDDGHNAATWECWRRPVTEQLLMGAADRGAVLVIGPTRGTKQLPNAQIGRHLMINKDRGDRTWGEVFAHAMRDMLTENPAADEHLFQYVLEGDPAVVVSDDGPPTDLQAREGKNEFGAAYPNPARGRSAVAYSVASRAPVQVTVYDVAGRRVRRLLDRLQAPGAYSVTWDQRDEAGRRVAPGVYLVHMRIGEEAQTRKLVVAQ